MCGIHHIYIYVDGVRDALTRGFYLDFGPRGADKCSALNLHQSRMRATLCCGPIYWHFDYMLYAMRKVEAYI